MKLLFVINSLGTGGAERSSADLWYFLQDQGVHFEVVALRHRHEGVEREVLSSGIKVRFLAEGGFWSQIKQLRQIIDTYQPDLIHSVLFSSNLRIRIVKNFSTKFIHVESLVNTTYDNHRLSDPSITWPKLKGYQALDSITAYFYTDHFHAITKSVAIHYQNKLGVAREKLQVIPRGRLPNPHLTDVQLQDQYREQFNIEPEEIVLISTGRQEFQKGHTHFIEALRELKLRYKFSNFKYILLGREGQMTAEITNKIKSYGLESDVMILGHRYDVEKILTVGDIFVFPSMYEGLGVALIEAQAAGLPVVCSDIPVFHEVTRPGKNAILVDTGDVTGLAEAVYRLATNPTLRDEFSRASLANFAERFDLNLVHRQMLDLFASLIEQE